MTLAESFKAQASHCLALGSPFMNQLCLCFAENMQASGAVMDKIRSWPGDPSAGGDALALRIAGGLHALALSGAEPQLAAAYPPSEADNDHLWRSISLAITGHSAFLCDWIETPPQTNEVRRSAALIPVSQYLANRFGLPLQLSELGSSGGLNLFFDNYAVDTGATILGSKSPILTLTPDWQGTPPANNGFTVVERRGVDLNPLDIGTKDGRLRLMSYLWPDQAERLERTRAALAGAEPVVDKGNAVDWLERRLAPASGRCHLIFNTIAWQYFKSEDQERGAALLVNAGLQATHDAPIAHFAMEGALTTKRAKLTLKIWPGNEVHDLGEAGFHGQIVDWKNPK
jgi:hypothetical protein